MNYTPTRGSTPIGKQVKDLHNQFVIVALYIRKWLANGFTMLLVFWWIQSGQIVETAKTTHAILQNTTYVATHLGGLAPWKHHSD